MKKYGFSELSRKPLTDISATAVEYRHDHSGARLLHLERKDENKTFMIAFKTPPTDSTGVFHIIEHSVLCGSKKYSLKDPFVELLKGSLNTFLNAMTYPDKTVYPVSSMNDRDFLNLVSVYMDAVFNPSFLECENIFLQEGHRLEITDGGVAENGVVLNEMLGAYSSPEEIESEEIMAMLYPNSPYAFSSGGAPESIVGLTYSDFVEAYKKHYTPSNAYIVLDGDVNLDEVLPLLDSYLSELEYKESDISIAVPCPAFAGKRVLPYPISEDESPENKTRMALGMRTFSSSEREKNLALAVIRGAVAASQNSPFCKAVLDSGLCEDVYVTPLEELSECGMSVSFINVCDGGCERLLSLALTELKKYTECGIDKDALRSSLSSLEFSTREKNYGSYPTGVIYALSVMESWLYSPDATAALSYSEVFGSLRDKIDSDYYEKILAEVLPSEDEATVLILTPDRECAEQTAMAEAERCQKIYDALTEKDRSELAASCEAFNLWQSRTDTKEELECLPKLSLSDINPIPKQVTSRKIGKPAFGRVFDIDTSGINYLTAFFDVSDLTLNECTDLAVLASALAKMPTEQHNESELFSYIKGKLGFISFSPVASLHSGGECINTLKLSLGVLSENADYVAPIVKEVCCTSRFTSDILSTTLKRMSIYMRENMCADGTSLAIDRVQAAFSKPSTINEYYSGYEAYLKISEYASDDKRISELSARLEALAKRIFVRERVKLYGAGELAERIIYDVFEALPFGTPAVGREYKTLPAVCEGIEIPTRTAFTALGFPMAKRGSTAAYDVVKTILSYEFLWNEIRAVGGAYGAGGVLRDGFGAFYSYRDPSPKRSLEKYLELPEFLEGLCEKIEKDELEKYIIGTFAQTDGVKSARMSFDIECVRALRGITYKRRAKRRLEMLNTDKEDIVSFAKMLKRRLKKSVSCTVASHEQLLNMGETVEVINKIV